MTAVLALDDEEGVTWVGRPMELVRALDPVYLDQARANFDEYVARTLAASQVHGGRFNRKAEFGALYTASDEATAWAEVAARFQRQGVDALPPIMGLLGIIVLAGRYVDLADADACAAWSADERALGAADPTSDQQEHCWILARAIRSLADFLMSPSARADGRNVPLFPDRFGSELRMKLQHAEVRDVPRHLAQQPSEAW